MDTSHSTATLYACGCGDPVKPGNKYILRHHRRKSFAEYSVEDRGYKTPCWIWQRTIITDGYGQAWINGKPQVAHRTLYERYHGPIQKGLVLDHLCSVTACVNPEHLDPVTQSENMKRAGRRRRLMRQIIAECPCCSEKLRSLE